MRQRYWNTPQTAMIPREVAQQIARERNALARELEQTRHELQRTQAVATRLLHQQPPQHTHNLQEENDALRARIQHLEAQAQQARQAQELAESERDTYRKAWAEQEDIIATLQEDLETLHTQLQDCEDLRRDVQRLQRRNGEDIRNATRATRRALLQGLFELGDTIDLAIEAAPHAPQDPWYQGMVGIQRQFRAILTREGITALGTPGDTFDPAQHEAVGLGLGETSGQILQVQRVGYAFEDASLARPAQVIVSR